MTKGGGYERRQILVYFITISVALVFIVRLFFLQIVEDRYKFFAENNVLRKITLYPDRGFVYDRNGLLIVANQPAYDIMVVPRELRNFDTTAFCADLGIDSLSFCESWAAMKKRIGYSSYKPNRLIKQVMGEQYARFQEKLDKYPGIYVQKRSLRSYPYPYGANVFGYIREVSEAVVKRDKSYKPGDYIGTSGIEKSYEKELRGKRGKAFVLVDVHNREQGPYEGGKYDTIPEAGKDLVCTIDMQLQMYAQELMKNKRGSIVAIEPSSGEILTLVTAPSYDPNLLLGQDRSKNYLELDADSIHRPLYDRSLLAQYPPGSPFKLLVGMAAMQEGTVSKNTNLYCSNGFNYGSLHVGDHAPRGNYQMEKAVMYSSNCYFCNIFKDMVDAFPTADSGMNVWSDHIKSFGLGNYLNNDLYTGRKGYVPNGDYYNRMYGKRRWRAVTAISLAIGQGEMLVTPIQLANMTAAIANRGYYFTPHIVKSIGGEAIQDSNFTIPKQTTIEPRHFEPIINGMFGVFEDPDGTAFSSRLKGVEMCGKTGTAENPHGQDHSIFVAFAPKDDPKIALAIIVENGYWGSRWAAPIASLIMEKYLHGEISRPEMEKRMLDGSLMEEYESQIQQE
jgi:penicillin-binding protein 2